jgi:acyl-CoA synthetase (NDP forming)
MSETNNSFHSLFYPKTIAIVGASENPIGGIKYLQAMRLSGYLADGGQIYLINPKYKELQGLPVYPDLADPNIPQPLDMVIIAVSAPHVPGIIRSCHNRAKYAIIYTSGFGESENRDLEIELRKAMEESNVKVIGPNGLGILNPLSKVVVYPKFPLCKGDEQHLISYIAQSGGTMSRFYIYLGSLGLGFHNVVSIGNAYGISPTELIQYFATDEKTTTIALYLESIVNGREFMQTAKKITPLKPILLWKGGQSDRGIKATFSHTGGLAGSYKVWQAMAHQSGIIMADHFELFADLGQVIHIRPICPENLNVAIIVAGGGIGVEFTDVFERNGLNIVDLSPETQAALAKQFPSINTNFKNPVDLGEYAYVPSLFSAAMKIIMKDPNIGSVVFVREPERFGIISAQLGIEDPQKETIDGLVKILKKFPKPVFCNPSTNSESTEAFAARNSFQIEMIKAGIPVINYIQNVPPIIKELYHYGRFLSRTKNT